MNIAALDPGRDKCGLAVLTENGKILEQTIIATVWLADEIIAMFERYMPKLLLLGNGTTSRKAKETIENALPELEIILVDEYKTTEEAKSAYWVANPPKGWRRFFPLSMQVPPVPVDDYVAIILAQRYLINQQFKIV